MSDTTYYSLNFSGEEINNLLSKIKNSTTLNAYGITDTYTKQEIDTKLLEEIDNVFNQNDNTGPYLSVVQKQNNYVLIYKDSDGTEQELFNFTNLNIPKNISELNNDEDYATINEVEDNIIEKIDKVFDASNEYPRLYIKQKQNSYALTYIDSDGIEHELFDFINLNIPTKTSDLTNDSDYITSETLNSKINRMRGGAPDRVVLSKIDGDIQLSNYTISSDMTVLTPPSSVDNTTIIPTASAVQQKINQEMLSSVPEKIDEVFTRKSTNYPWATPRLDIDNISSNNNHYQLYYMDSDSESRRHLLFDFSDHFLEKEDVRNLVSFYDCENDEVSQYMNQEPYSTSDYTYSNVNTNLTIRKDIPENFTISIPYGATSIKIVDCLTGQEYRKNFTSSDTTYTIKNLIPNRLYRYCFLDNNKKIVKNIINQPYCGQIVTRGQIRMIDVPKADGTRNLFNIRDIGGWKCKDGVLKYGLIYRGSRLNGSDYESGARTNSEIILDDTQKSYLKNVLNIADEIDLRSSGQRPSSSSILNENDAPVTYVAYSLPYYQLSLTSLDYANIIHRIAENLKANKVTYIHCLAGSDRTTQVCAFIQALCGVKQEDIDKDFELSSNSFEYDSTNTTGDFIYVSKRNLRQRTNSSWQQFLTLQSSNSGATTIQGNTLQEKAINFLLTYHPSFLSETQIREDIQIIQNCLIQKASPVKVSDLVNDKGYLVASDIENKLNKLGNGNKTIIQATNDGNIERSQYSITENSNSVNSQLSTHQYIPTSKAIGQAIDDALANAPFVVEETGVIDHDNVGWYTQDTSNYYVMTGTYSKIGNSKMGEFCFLQATARLKNTWQNISYSLPMVAAAPVQTIIVQGGAQYVITIPTTIEGNPNYSVLDIRKFDGTDFSSDDTIQFTLIYQV